MIQSIKFNSKKNKSINQIFNTNTENKEYYNNVPKFEKLNFLSKQINEFKTKISDENSQIIKIGKLQNKNNLEYKIIKESFTNTYLLQFPKIIIFHINESDYPSFVNQFKKQDIYLFYSCKSLQNLQVIYHIFCFSHLKSELNETYLKFCFNNYSDINYLLLESIYCSFLILNESFKDFYDRKSGNNNPRTNFHFVEKIGLGPEKYSYIKTIFHFYKEYIKNTFLPINYLNN
jgi:hypothetical protein